MGKLDLEKAKNELSNKTLDEVQEGTAWTWGSRAAISYQNCLNATGTQKLALWSIAEEYFHEAVEHAALVSNKDVLTELKKELVPYQEKTAKDMDNYFGK